MTSLPTLLPGMNGPLPAGPVRLALDMHVATDHFILALDESGKVTGDQGLCFYNQPDILDGSVLLDSATVAIDLDGIPEAVRRLVICAKPEHEGVTFGGLPPLHLVASAGGQTCAHLDLKNRGMRETALIMAEVYRRNGGWRIRCVSQGYAAGIEALLTAYGVDLTADASAQPDAAEEADQPMTGSVLPAPRGEMGALSALAAERFHRAVNMGPGSARVVLALDLSGSMDENYRSGRMDPHLQAAAATAHALSPDGTADLMFFGRNLHRHGPVDTESCLDASGLALRKYLLESRTLYAGMMQHVRELAADGQGPVLAIVIADGGPDDLDRAEWELSGSVDEPVFWSFVGLECGAEVLDRRRFGFLESIRRDQPRNAAAFFVRADLPIGPEELIEEISDQLRRVAPSAGLPEPT